MHYDQPHGMGAIFVAEPRLQGETRELKDSSQEQVEPVPLMFLEQSQRK
jgi:hypothetical protein